MAKLRHPLAVDLTYGAWGSQTNPISDYLTAGINVLAEKRAGEPEIALTQRPAFARYVIAPDSVTTSIGRASYYWAETDTLYIVNNDTIYTNGYSTNVGNITAGTSKVFILEMVGYLVFLDPENGEGWYLDNVNVLTQISDSDFPSTLAGGGAVLNQSVYVMDIDGTIYRSALNDPSSWDPLDIITAERDPDAGCFLTKHRGDLVAVGTKTIEFFYDAGNPQGSPLARREDVTYRVGALDNFSFVTIDDVTVFVGVSSSGELAVYKIEGYEVAIVSNPTVGSFLTSLNKESGIGYFAVSGGYIMGHTLVYITPLQEVSGLLRPYIPYTLVYDGTSQLWHPFTTNLTETGAVDIVQWTDRLQGSSALANGILSNGDILFYATTSLAQDYEIQDPYVVDGYVLPGYVEGGASDFVSIDVRIIPQVFDGTIGNNKFMHKIELHGRFTSVVDMPATPFQIAWYDDDVCGIDPLPVHFRDLYLLPRRKLTRCGKFNRRVFYIDFSGPERFVLWGLELDFDISGYA